MREMVLPHRIELWTSPLPREYSTSAAGAVNRGLDESSWSPHPLSSCMAEIEYTHNLRGRHLAAR
jgi:hypothetical protein